MNKIIYVVTLLIATGSTNLLADSYKCRSPNGKITYAGQISLTPGVTCEQLFVKKKTIIEPASSDTTNSPKGAPEVEETDTGGLPSVEQGNKQPTPDAKPKAAPQPPPASPTVDQKKTNADVKKSATEEETKKSEKLKADKQAEQTKLSNCENAKTNLRTYQVGGRISKVDEKGERAFLDDGEIKKKAEEAKAEVEKWCGS